MNAKNEYVPKEMKIADRPEMTEDTVLLTIKTGMNPSPGQFIQMSIPGIGECPISICSYNKSKIELLVRNTGNVTKHIFALKKGDSVFVRGPYGTGYPMEEMMHHKIVVIAGGTGLAPPKSVIEYIDAHKKKFGKLSIFIGFRDPNEKLFSCFLGNCEKNHNVCLTYDKDPGNSGCRVGFVTDLVNEAEITPDGTSVVMCGPPVMISAMNKVLAEKGFSDEQIYISLERHMKCGIGKCGHCSISGKYVCRDGPVFRLDKARNYID